MPDYCETCGSLHFIPVGVINRNEIYLCAECNTIVERKIVYNRPLESQYRLVA